MEERVSGTKEELQRVRGEVKERCDGNNDKIEVLITSVKDLTTT